MKSVIIILLIVIIASFRLEAQKFQNSKAYKIEKNTIDDFREDRFINNGGFVGGNIKYAEIAGSPYLNKDFRAGSLLLANDSLIENCLIRYNIYTDQIEHIDSGKVYEIAPKSMVKKIHLDQSVLVCLKNNEKGKTNEHYFEELTSGKVSLYIRYAVQFVPPATSFPYAKTDSAHFSSPMKTYYLSNAAHQLIRVTGRKVLLKIFADKKRELKEFLRTSRFPINSEADIRSITSFYNNL